MYDNWEFHLCGLSGNSIYIFLKSNYEKDGNTLSFFGAITLLFKIKILLSTKRKSIVL